MADQWQRSGVEYVVRDLTRAGTAGVLRNLDRLERASRGVVHTVSRVAGGLAGIAGIGSVAGIAVLVRQQMQAVDAAAKWSDRLGIATEELIGLHHAAELSGVGVSQVNMALQRMTRRVAEAAQGTGEAQEALKILGLDAAALTQQSPDRIFLAIADALAKIPNQGERVQLAFKLFDSEGVAMLNILQAGREGIAAMTGETKRFGTAISRLDAAQIERANNAIANAKEATQGLVRQVTIDLAPYIEGIADRFTEAAVSGQDFGDTLVDTLIAVAIAAARVYDEIEKVTGIVGQVVTLGAHRVTPPDPAVARRLVGGQGTGEAGAARSMEVRPRGDAEKAAEAWGAELKEWMAAQRAAQRGKALGEFAMTWLGEEAGPEGFAAPGGGGAARLQEAEAAEQASAAVDKLLASLQRERQVMELSAQGTARASEQLTLYEQAAAAFGEGSREYEDAIRRYHEAVTEIGYAEKAKEAQEARDAVAVLDAELAEAIVVTEEMAAGHAYAAEMLAYERAVWQAYGDDIETATRKIEEYRAKLEKLEKNQRRLSVGPLMEWADVAEQGLESLASTLTDIALDFENASDHAERFAAALAAMVVQEMVMRPLVRGIGSAFGLYGEVQHTGGVVGRGPQRLLAFHEGGMALGADEVIAKLRRREVVLTEDDANRLRRLGLLNAAGKPTFHDGGVVGAAGTSVAPQGRSDRPSVSVKIDNQTGTAVGEPDVGVTIDPDEYIVGVTLRNVEQGGPMRDLMRRGR